MNAAAGLVEVRVPDMGNFKDVAIIDVLVKPGEKIEAEAPLVTLETEKATMDVPSTVGGVVEKIHIAKGGTVSTGDLIVTVRAEGTAATPKASANTSAAPGGRPPQGSSGAAGSQATAGAPTQAAGSQPASSRSQATGPAARAAGSAGGQAAGSPVQPSRSQAQTSRAQTAASQAPSAPGQPAEAKAGTGTAPSASPSAPSGSPDLPPINEPGFSQAHAGPSVRRFARELGVDLIRVQGNGFKGRVTHDDVKAFVKEFLARPTLTAAGATGAAASAAKAVSAAGGESSLPAVPVVDFSLYGEIETKPLSRIQKISGPRLHASWVNIPHVTQFDEADITDLEELRNELKETASQARIKLTPLAFIMRACVKALQEFPIFNSSLDPKGANLILKKYIHVGFAADTPNGLVVPVVPDANRKDIYELAHKLGELSEKARAGKLSAAEMQGGSFTISSLGGIGGTAFTPIINAPEVAILGVSRSTMKPVFRDGAFAPRLILPLSLSYDHRVIDGASAARFTTFLAHTLSDPRALAEAVP
jgi:pyruvate dehydrogenase E2 component (dihydrolipoyllysine-residue acetyltransferase)